MNPHPEAKILRYFCKTVTIARRHITKRRMDITSSDLCSADLVREVEPDEVIE